MADEATNETTTTKAESEPGTPPAGERKFTQEDVDRIVGERLKRAEKKAKPAEAPPQGGDDADKVTKRQLQEQIEELRLRNAFSEAASEYEIPRAARRDLFDLYKTQKPADDAEWFTAKVESFGLKGKQMSTPNNNGPAAPVAPPAAAPSAPTKVDPLTSGGLVDLFHLSPAQLDQLGPSGVREAFEKALEAGNQRSGAPPRPRIGERRK